MGVGFSMLCRDCKVTSYVGYGSYGTWFYPKNYAEWCEQAKHNLRDAMLRKNQLMRKFLKLHLNHDVIQDSGDITFVKGKDLMIESGYMGSTSEVFIKDYDQWTHENPWDDERPAP